MRDSLVFSGTHEEIAHAFRDLRTYLPTTLYIRFNSTKNDGREQAECDATQPLQESRAVRCPMTEVRLMEFR
jgi:hypothetical protein